MRLQHGKENEKQQEKLKHSNITKITLSSSLSSASFVIILLLAVITGLFSSSFSPHTTDYSYVYAATTEQQQKADVSLSTLINQGSPYLGDPYTAHITIIDFSDFQCYLCARYVKATEPLVNQTYIQTGKVILIFKHLPNRGFDSMDAALAAQCTNDQGKFWQFHKKLYDSQKTIDSGWVSKDNLKKFASQIAGLNMQQFEACFDNKKYKNLIENDLKLASSFGFQDTPSFIIVNSKDGSNPEILKGPYPFPSFKAIIDKKLKEGAENIS
jgi:protein-disulfide isomerase